MTPGSSTSNAEKAHNSNLPVVAVAEEEEESSDDEVQYVGHQGQSNQQAEDIADEEESSSDDEDHTTWSTNTVADEILEKEAAATSNPHTLLA